MFLIKIPTQLVVNRYIIYSYNCYERISSLEGKDAYSFKCSKIIASFCNRFCDIV